ncbi:porin [Ferrimonas senticii]|uniref:porin n=1 Tax=Ferrimonas senticii TaxID=394566 RepID=UPI0004255138|nr:porin [Ferrimonas senticii]
MKKTLLAAAIPALMMASSVSAVELYNDGANSVAMGGHVSVALMKKEGGETEVTDNSPRINFTFKRALNDDLTLEAKTEWAMNFADSEGEQFSNRLGYIALHSKQFGSASVGQQWSAFYDVAAVTDTAIIFGNDYLYNVEDTYRFSDSIVYRKGFDFGDMGALNFGVQWKGAKDANIDDRIGGSVAYSVAGVTLGYAHISGDVATVEQKMDLLSVKYGTYGKGIYAAANYTKAENILEFADSIAIDAVAAYGFDNGLNVSLNYEIVEDDNSSKVDYETIALVAEYAVAKNLVVYAGYQDALEENKAQVDTATIGARVFF